jgi:hypothetical protein
VLWYHPDGAYSQFLEVSDESVVGEDQPDGLVIHVGHFSSKEFEVVGRQPMWASLDGCVILGGTPWWESPMVEWRVPRMLHAVSGGGSGGAWDDYEFSSALRRLHGLNEYETDLIQYDSLSF